MLNKAQDARLAQQLEEERRARVEARRRREQEALKQPRPRPSNIHNRYAA